MRDVGTGVGVLQGLPDLHLERIGEKRPQKAQITDVGALLGGQKTGRQALEEGRWRRRGRRRGRGRGRCRRCSLFVLRRGRRGIVFFPSALDGPLGPRIPPLETPSPRMSLRSMI